MINSFKDAYVEIIGYGVSVRSVVGDVKNTVAFDELRSLDLPEELICIDLVRSNSDRRPKLHNLLETTGRDSVLVLYSIDSLLVGNKNDGLSFYDWMLELKLEVVVYDMSGRWPRWSEFCISRTEMENNPELRYTKLEALENYYNANRDNFLKRRINRKVTAEFFLTDSPFKEIYYAYESYQIDLPTTMELLKEYCGVNNVITLRKLVHDYEKTILFPREFDSYYQKNKFILDLPKRCGLIPDEFFELKNLINEYKLNNSDKIENMSEEEIFNAAAVLSNIICTYPVFRRWELAYMKKPKPRKPVLRNFDINEFKKKFKPIEKESDND